jgi:hypothetical protein
MSTRTLHARRTRVPGKPGIFPHAAHAKWAEGMEAGTGGSGVAREMPVPAPRAPGPDLVGGFLDVGQDLPGRGFVVGVDQHADT